MQMLLVSLWLLVFKFLQTSGSYCCCCDVSNYYDMNRTWVQVKNCQSPSICCQIPTKDECEIQLNPTYDGTCGHNNEKKNQRKHGGVEPQKIPRPGKNEMQGWFGQRIYDINGNEIEEWCIDNYNYDSFFLWRFVSCNGDYPHWFGRCAFPSATNILMYEACNDTDFEKTIPSCFGEIQEMNIGLGNDYGHDIDYRYDVDDETLGIWCTNYTYPKNPPPNVVGPAPGENDGIVPFYLDKCRKYNEDISSMPMPLPLKPNNINELNENEKSKFIDQYTTENNMLPLTFRVNMEMKILKDNFYEFIINSNHMPLGYEAIIYENDNWSISFSNKNIKVINIFINEMIKNDWKYNINNNIITFTYINSRPFYLYNHLHLDGFIIEINSKCDYIGWIARSNHSESSFMGFGKFEL